MQFQNPNIFGIRSNFTIRPNTALLQITMARYFAALALLGAVLAAPSDPDYSYGYPYFSSASNYGAAQPTLDRLSNIAYAPYSVDHYLDDGGDEYFDPADIIQDALENLPPSSYYQ